jgi:hypothetical protein
VHGSLLSPQPVIPPIAEESRDIFRWYWRRQGSPSEGLRPRILDAADGLQRPALLGLFGALKHAIVGGNGAFWQGCSRSGSKRHPQSRIARRMSSERAGSGGDLAEASMKACDARASRRSPEPNRGRSR